MTGLLTAAGIEDVRRAERQRELLYSIGMLVQQEAEIRCRRPGQCQRQKHSEKRRRCGRGTAACRIEGLAGRRLLSRGRMRRETGSPNQLGGIRHPLDRSSVA